MFPPTVGIWFTNQGDEVRARSVGPATRRALVPSDAREFVLRFVSQHTLSRKRQVFKKLKALYDEEPYPTQERMEELAEEFGAPDWTKIENFFKNMQLKHQEQFQ